jgi:ADP-heptose:LPS heptosyltransferase
LPGHIQGIRPDVRPGVHAGVGPIGAPLPDVGRIAVLRGGGLGDLLFSLPAIQSLADAYPDAEITLLGTAEHARLLRDRPGPVRRVLELPGVPEPPIDLAVQLHGGGRWSNGFVRGLGARWTVGARTPDAEPLDRCLPYRFYQHEVLRALEVVGLAGAPPTRLEPRLAVTQRDLSAAGTAVAGLPQPYVAVHPGAGDPRRRWPAERFACVAAELTRRGYGVLVLGSPPEAELVADVVRRTGGPAVRNTAGTLSLPALVGVLARSALMIGNDSGPRHLAQAVGTRTVSVYWSGNIITCGPFGRSRHRVQVSWTSACPVCGADCTSPHGRRCEHEVSFVDNVPLAAVLDDVADLLWAE